MLAFPHESNRKIARDVGLSEGTVRDVRRQIKRAAEALSKEGDNPVEPAPIGASLASASKLRQSPASKAKRSDCTQCASWLVAHVISRASLADLLDNISVSQCPAPVIMEALGISESGRALAVQPEQRGGKRLPDRPVLAFLLSRPSRASIRGPSHDTEAFLRHGCGANAQGHRPEGQGLPRPQARLAATQLSALSLGRPRVTTLPRKHGWESSRLTSADKEGIPVRNGCPVPAAHRAPLQSRSPRR
jgi:hypothetical protein